MPQEVKPSQRALIFMTARNCEKYVGPALRSLAAQTHRHLHVLFIDDASTDGTGVEAGKYLNDLFHGRHTLVRNDTVWGKARNAHVHLRGLLPKADFVAVLDGDDQLVVPDILSRMAGFYAAGKDVVWTNFVTDLGAVGNNRPLEPQLSPRQQGWRTSHLFSFRAELLANVDESYFKRADGQWFPAACDFAIAFPILDQTRRYQFIPEQAYRYTSTNPLSHHNADPQSRGLNSTIQMACAKEVLAKPPLPCTRPLQAPLATSFAARPIDAGPAAAAPATKSERAVNAWQHMAAQRLATECPEVLDIAGTADLASLEPLQAWALHSLLGTLRPRPRVLEVGQGPWAGLLAVLTQHRQGHFWSMGTDAARCRQLEGSLRAARCTQDVALVIAPLVAGEMFNVSGLFPDVSTLGDVDDFDLVVVSDGAVAQGEASALHSLPAVAGRMSTQGFKFLLATASPHTRQRAMAAWHELSPDLEYTDGGCAGLGLLVTGSTSAGS